MRGENKLRNEVMKLKKHVYRATGISLLILLFGALGAGFLFVVGNIFGVQILKPGSAISEMLWHLFFWATDFFFVAFVLILSLSLIHIFHGITGGLLPIIAFGQNTGAIRPDVGAGALYQMCIRDRI